MTVVTNLIIGQIKARFTLGLLTSCLFPGLFLSGLTLSLLASLPLSFFPRNPLTNLTLGLLTYRLLPLSALPLWSFSFLSLSPKRFGKSLTKRERRSF
jgi:hypothetical protein